MLAESTMMWAESTVIWAEYQAQMDACFFEWQCTYLEPQVTPRTVEALCVQRYYCNTDGTCRPCARPVSDPYTVPAHSGQVMNPRYGILPRSVNYSYFHHKLHHPYSSSQDVRFTTGNNYLILLSLLSLVPMSALFIYLRRRATCSRIKSLKAVPMVTVASDAACEWDR